MPLESDIPFAARRVAEIAREMAGNPLYRDIVTLLPVLDAVAAGQDPARVERYARAICRAEGMDPDGCLEGSPDWMYREAEARAAIALADAERAAAMADRWVEYDEAVEQHEESAFFVGWADCDDGEDFQKRCDQQRVTRATLDAAVRRFAGLSSGAE